MTNSARLTFQWAAKYLSLEWSVIPLKPKSKEPLIPWQEFQHRKSSLEEMQMWIDKWPSMNLGIVTGQISNVVVVDLDGKVGITFGQQHHLVTSLISVTGKGKQIFYKWEKETPGSVSKIAPHVDLRGDGNYVVVPLSIHPNGKRYRWERFVPQELQPIPVGLLSVGSASIDTVLAKAKPEGWIARALEEMKIGNIDDTLTSVLGRLRRDGYTSVDAQTLLLPHAVGAGAEPGHLEEKIKNIWNRYEPSTNISSNSPSIYRCSTDVLPIHSPDNNDSFNKYTSQLATIRSDSGLRTGFPTLDKYFEGGLKSERLFTVAARTGVGKTNFGIALSSNLCQTGKKVLYFSTEFQYQKIWSRYIATLSQPERFRAHSFYVVDAYSPNLEQVEEAIKKVNPDVFIFDFIQHIGKEKEVLTQFMRGCQFLQRQYNCQGIILAQLNRNADWVEDGKRIEPRMSFIEGSSTIEQASSRVLLLSEVRVTPEYNEIIGVLDKNDTGDKGIINFALYKNPYRFKELV